MQEVLQDPDVRVTLLVPCCEGESQDFSVEVSDDNVLIVELEGVVLHQIQLEAQVDAGWCERCSLAYTTHTHTHTHTTYFQSRDIPYKPSLVHLTLPTSISPCPRSSLACLWQGT